MTEKFFLTNKSGIKLECGIETSSQKSSDENKLPIIFIAGGRGSNAFQSATQTVLTEIFLRHNFAVFRMNFQGNGASDGDYTCATVSSGMEDMQAGIDYIQKLNWADHGNISLCGSSWGGGICFHMAAANQLQKYKFLILLSPEIDMKSKFERNPEINLCEWKKNGIIKYNSANGKTETRPYILYEDALIHNPWPIARNIKIPTLIIHGDSDKIIPYEQSVRLCNAIDGSELITITDCGHTYYKCGKLDDAMHSVENWVVQNNFAIQ